MLNKNFRKTILSALVVCLGFISPIGFNTTPVKAQGTEATGSFVNEYNAETGVLEFGNQYLTRTFQVTDSHVKTQQLNNKVAGINLLPQEGTQDFIINTLENNLESQKVTVPQGKIEQERPADGTNAKDDPKAWVATSDSEDGQETNGGNAQYIFDGNDTTFYHSDYHSNEEAVYKYPHHIFIDFRKPITMNSLSYHKRMHEGSPTVGGHINEYVIYSFDSDEACKDVQNKGTEVARGSFADNRNVPVEYVNFKDINGDGTGITTQFLRLEIVSSHNHQNDGNVKNDHVTSIGELNFYTDKVVFPEPTVETIYSNDLVMEGNPLFSVENDTATLRINFQPINARGVNYTISEVFTMKSNDKFMRKHLEISADDAANAKIDYIDLENMKFSATDADPNVKPGTMTSNFWTLKDQPNNPDMSGQHGKYLELGQPYYVGAMYWGCEFPETENKIRAIDGVMTGFIRYYYGKNLTLESDSSDTQFHYYNNYNGANGVPGKMVTWDAVVGAARNTKYQVCQSDFYSYIETIATPTKFRQQFNSWYDNMKEINNTNILESFAEVEKGFTQYGIEPLDSYVVDDGWQIAGSLWKFNDKFPNQLYDSSQQVNQMASNFGLWLGPRGGYGETVSPLVDYLVNSGQGSRNERLNDANVSDGRYLDGLTSQVFLDYQTKFNINYWKLDGMLWAPSHNPNNYHVVGNEYYTVSETYERWTDMYERMREERENAGSDLWINMTSYANPSPWFLQWVNSLWMQNTGDTGFDYHSDSNRTHKWGANDQQSMLTYRDGDYYDFFNDNQWQLPNKYFYNHDPVYAKTAHRVDNQRTEPINYSTEGLREHLYMLGTRGTAFWEYYYSPSMFDHGKWQVNAESAKWIEDNFYILENSKMFGGNPRNGDIYGYSCWDDANGAEGIVSLRNPKNETQKITVRYNDEMGVPASAKDLSAKVIIGNETKYQNEETLSYDTVKEYELGAFEVLIIQYGAKDVKAPTILTLKGNNNELKVEFDETMRSVNKDNFTVVKVEGQKEIPVTIENAQLEEDRRTAKLTLTEALEDTATYKVQVNKAMDTVGNECNESFVNEYFNNAELATITNFNGDGNSEVNKGSQLSVDGRGGFTVTAKFQTNGVNATLAEQKDVFTFGIDGEGYLTFTFNGMTVNSKHTVTTLNNEGKPVAETVGKVNDGVTHVANAVKEPNGMIKIYLDGKVVASKYDETVEANPFIQKSDVIFGKGFNGTAEYITLSDKPLAFDEVSSLTPVRKNVALESNGTVASAFDVTTQTAVTQKNDKPFSYSHDGNKSQGSYGELNDTPNQGPRHSRYFQYELKEAYDLDSITLIRYFETNNSKRFYGPTVIALYDESDVNFENPTIVFNTDKFTDENHKNGFHGLGLGEDPYYNETPEGITIDLTDRTKFDENVGKNTKVIRVYVSGRVNEDGSQVVSTSDHIVELEAYGIQAPTTLPQRPDYNKLEEAVKEYENTIKSDLYTPNSVDKYKANLANDLDAAKTILKDKKETNNVNIDRLVAKFKNEKDTLVARADFEAAETLLKAFNELNKDVYTKDSWKEFVDSKAKENLETAINNKNITQADLDKVVEASKDSQAKLELRADVTKAKEALDASKGLVKKEYTKDSWKAFEAAKKALEAVVKNNSNTNQTELDRLLAEFNLAKDGLVRKDEPKPTPTPTTKPESTPTPSEKPTPTVKPDVKPVAPQVEAQKAPAYDDGGPFTTDECGSVYDRWGNLMWKSPVCNAQGNDGYNLVHTGDK